jgi:SAM-dependent methyltransferase
MTALPLRAGSVDAVTAYHSVFHVPRDEHPGVYAEFARVLRPGGLLLATVGSGAYETTRPDWLGTGRSMFWSTPGRRATRAQLRDAGFELVWEREVDDPLGSSVPFVLARLSG